MPPETLIGTGLDYFWPKYYPKTSSTRPFLVPFQRLKAPFSRSTSARATIGQTLYRFLVEFTESTDEQAFEGYLAGFCTYPVAIPTGESVVYAVGDIGQPQTSQRIVNLAVERFGGVDVLLNNAGVFQPKPFLDHTEEDLDSYLNLLRGYFFMSQVAIAQMRQRGGGAIVNIGSMWSNHAIAATPCSGSSTAKGGVHALTRDLAIEFAPDKIRVNAIAPAVVETPLFEPLLTPEQLASLNAFHPLGRNGQVKDTTAAILFLADDACSSWITGVVLPVDGGVTAGRN